MMSPVTVILGLVCMLGSRILSNWRRGDSIAKLENGFQCSERGLTIVFLLAFRQLVIGNEARVKLLCVVTTRPMGPALGNALRRPDIVCVFRKALGQRPKLWSKHDTRRVDRGGLVCHWPR